MRRRYTAAPRKTLILSGLVFALLSIGACSEYDPELLQAAHELDSPRDAGKSPMRNDAQVGNDPHPVADAGRTPDAGPMPDAGTHDSGAAHDGSVMDGASPDATPPDPACLNDVNPIGIDCCPDDPSKTDPGACGCGIADTDSDSDTALDCDDGCPNDAAKTAPGACGCGVPEADADGATSCTGIKLALIHRYRFDGSGTSVLDSVGTAHGTVVNAQLTGTGAVTLAGDTSDQYVDLPNKLVSVLKNATFEAWITWSGGAIWQRIFDFGEPSSGGEGKQGASGRTYLFLTTSNADGMVRASYRRTTGGETVVSASSMLPAGALKHVAVVFDDDNDLLALYVDGALAMSTPLTGTLASINDINNWIGRSQFSVDPELAATVHEFRIYNTALSAPQLAISFAAGPDPMFLEP